jgi:hypothetical protein
MKQLNESGIGTWPNSERSRGGDVGGGYRHASAMPTEPRTYQPSWSSDNPMPPPQLDRASVFGPPGPPRYSYHPGDTPQNFDPLVPKQTGRSSTYQDPYPPPAQQYQPDQTRPMPITHEYNSTLPVEPQFVVQRSRGNSDPAANRDVAMGTSMGMSVHTSEQLHSRSGGFRQGHHRNAGDSGVGSVSPSIPTGLELERTSSSINDRRFEHSVPLLRGTPWQLQSFQSPHQGGTIPLSLATSSSTSLSSSATGQYQPTPMMTFAEPTTSRVTNASPLHSMWVLEEAVPLLPASGSSKTSSRGPGSLRERERDGDLEDELVGQQDRDRDRDRDRPRKRAKTRTGTGTGDVNWGTSKEASVVHAREMVSST